MPDLVMSVLEIIGTISFAVSGAFVAIRAKLDVFGVIFVGCVTAFGGGILRDTLIGRFPPAIFLCFYQILIAALSAVCVFVVAYRHRDRFHEFDEKTAKINNLFDAVGLAAFSVMGTETAFTIGFSDHAFLSVMLGMLTGVGGGVFRDVLTDTTPYVFKKHIYAIASILGSCLYYLLRLRLTGQVLPTVCAMALVIGIRVLATRHRWSLPKVVFEKNE